MGNLQGSDKSKSSGKVSKAGLTKTKKSPVKDLFKHQVSGVVVGGKKTAESQRPVEDPVSGQPAVTAARGGGGNDRPGTVTTAVTTSTTSCAATSSGSQVIVTDSWRQVSKIQKSLESAAPVELSPSKEETSSSDSVFTDPLVTPQGVSDYSDGKECVDCRREEDDVTLTMETSEEEDSTPVASKKRLQANSLDALDEEAESPTKTKSLEPKTSSFTVVRHRKVELPPTKLSEQCLLLNTSSTATGRNICLFVAAMFIALIVCVYVVETYDYVYSRLQR